MLDLLLVKNHQEYYTMVICCSIYKKNLFPFFKLKFIINFFLNVQFRYFLVFSLAILLLTEDVHAWRRIKKFLRKAAKVIKTAHTIHTVVKVAATVLGKRSTNDQVMIFFVILLYKISDI